MRGTAAGMSDQLSLFGDVEPAAPAAAAAVDAALEARRAPPRRSLARGCPTRCASAPARGPSPAGPDWSIRPALSATALGREGLRHYARHPLLRTVGIDRSYYAPIPLDDLRAYADQLPAASAAASRRRRR